MSAMFDTMVLIYATRSGVAKDSFELRSMRTDARALLRNIEEIWISAITATEFLPYLKPDDAKRATDIIDRIRFLAFDPAASELAIELIRKKRSSTKLCRSCLNPVKASPCKTCGAKLPRPARLNDIYIAATAEVHPEVTTLYTYDSGIEELASELSVTIRRPPASSGPLFDGTSSTDAEVIPISSAIGDDGDE